MRIALGFDGSDTDDWTALRAETLAGYQFTPKYDTGSGDMQSTIWNPAEFGGKVPRGQVHAAVDYVFDQYDVVRMYCDPPDWKSEIEQWSLRYGEKIVVEWATYRVVPMHAALSRFMTDLNQKSITHDGCPLTELCMRNARKDPKPQGRYLLAKPHGAYHQKIDAAMASVLAHEAASDARAAGLAMEPEGMTVW